MSAAPNPAKPPTQADPSPDRPADGVAPTESGRLLTLVRRLLDFGRHLVSTLQDKPAPDAVAGIAHCFGTLNLALIIARITRGLRLAAALEDRLVRNARDRLTPHPPGTPAHTRPSIAGVTRAFGAAAP